MDLELSPAAVLLARGLIDPYQFDSLARVTFWLAKAARNLGPKPFAVGSLWTVMINGMIGTSTTVPISIGDGADDALTRLDRVLRQLDGSRDLVVALAEGKTPPRVLRAVERCLTREDDAALTPAARGF